MVKHFRFKYFICYKMYESQKRHIWDLSSRFSVENVGFPKYLNESKQKIFFYFKIKYVNSLNKNAVSVLSFFFRVKKISKHSRSHQFHFFVEFFLLRLKESRCYTRPFKLIPRKVDRLYYLHPKTRWKNVGLYYFVPLRRAVAARFGFEDFIIHLHFFSFSFYVC